MGKPAKLHRYHHLRKPVGRWRTGMFGIILKFVQFDVLQFDVQQYFLEFNIQQYFFHV